MSKTLATLVKLHTHEVDAQRRAVVELEEALAMTEKSLTDHLALMEKQRQISRDDVEAARALPAWIEAAINHERLLHNQIKQLNEWLEDSREELQRRYTELKKYEIALDAEQTRVAAERLRAEQIILDEIAGQRAGSKDNN